MAKVLMFKKAFGDTPTGFGDKIRVAHQVIQNGGLSTLDMQQEFPPKWHTIRPLTDRIKAGDWISPRQWSGRPYHSKQEVICPDLRVTAVKPIAVGRGAIAIGDEYLGIDGVIFPILCLNDGLTIEQFLEWFDTGENYTLICWHPDPEKLGYL